MADETDIPVILIGGNRNIDVMEDILSSTKIEYFSMARPLTAEPDLINKWTAGNFKSPKCISCNQCYFTHGKSRMSIKFNIIATICRNKLGRQ